MSDAIKLYSAWWCDANDEEHEETLLVTASEAADIAAALKARHPDASVDEWQPENRAPLSAAQMRARYRL